MKLGRDIARQRCVDVVAVGLQLPDEGDVSFTPFFPTIATLCRQEKTKRRKALGSSELVAVNILFCEGDQIH